MEKQIISLVQGIKYNTPCWKYEILVFTSNPQDEN